MFWMFKIIMKIKDIISIKIHIFMHTHTHAYDFQKFIDNPKSVSRREPRTPLRTFTMIQTEKIAFLIIFSL